MPTSRTSNPTDGHPDSVATFLNNEIVRSAVTTATSTDASLQFFHENRGCLTSLFQTTIAEGTLEQAILELHESHRGPLSRVVFDVSRERHRQRMSEPDVTAIVDTIPTTGSRDVVALLYPVVSGHAVFEPVAMEQTLTSLSAGRYTIQVGVTP